MRKLLWVGDAAVATGFARCTHHVLEELRKTWDVHVLGINYRGDPHSWPYPIYPCWPGGDGFGVGRTATLIARLKPELVLLQNDPWNIPEYLQKINGACPVVASMPVDGKNLKDGETLNKLAHAIFWTQFGLDEARAGGYRGSADVIPLGVDLDLYRPIDRTEARREVGIPEAAMGAFIVGNVNRNQPRKRLDLTVRAFARWIKDSGIGDAYLFLYVAPTGEFSYDCGQLIHYYGIKDRLILVQPHIGQGHEETWMPKVYSCFDVQVSTTQGEGWGLTTMEGMACGVPQVVPDWAALGEWCGNAVVKVPCTSTAVTPSGINVLGGIVDEDEMISAIHGLWTSRGWSNNSRLGWASCKERGLALVSRPEYRWPAIGQRFARALDGLVEQAKVA